MPNPEQQPAEGHPTTEILELARELIRIPSVSVGDAIRQDEIDRAADVVASYLNGHGLSVQLFDQGPFPAVFARFPGPAEAPVVLAGHFDVVAPEPDDSQFEPTVRGDYLWGRGAADMKTVVATYMVWMKETRRQGPPYPPVGLLLVGNEETGEDQPMGTPFVLRSLARTEGYVPDFMIAGERTGERGDEVWGKICTQNRGVMRFRVTGRGARGHSSEAVREQDVSERLFQARRAIRGIVDRHLTIDEEGEWSSLLRFPFVRVGTPGVYNITAEHGEFGVEIRPIPQDDIRAVYGQILDDLEARGLELDDLILEEGIECAWSNPYLQELIAAIGHVSGSAPEIGRKRAGTSARFAPGGQGVVWGQAGIGPHTRDERHFIPSIEPYYRALEAFGDRLRH